MENKKWTIVKICGLFGNPTRIDSRVVYLSHLFKVDPQNMQINSDSLWFSPG